MLISINPITKEVTHRLKIKTIGSILETMPRKRTENRRAWEKENIKSATIRYNVKTEPEFAEWMDKHKPYQPYIKGLIRADMENKTDQN